MPVGQAFRFIRSKVAMGLIMYLTISIDCAKRENVDRFGTTVPPGFKIPRGKNYVTDKAFFLIIHVNFP